MKTIQKEKGQAIAETVLTMGTLAAVVLAAATVYELMQADISANKVARLATWQGTLYQGLSQDEYEATFEQNVRTTFMQRDVVPFFEDDAGLVSLVGRPEDFAYRYESVDPTYAYPSNRSTTIANMAGLNENTISSMSVSIPVSASVVFNPVKHLRIGAAYAGGDVVEYVPTTVPYDPIADEYRYHVKGKAALLTNGFIPMNEAGFHEAISRISADGNPLTYFEVWRGTLDFFGFDEIDAAMGEEGLSTVAENQSRVLPEQLGTFTE